VLAPSSGRSGVPPPPEVMPALLLLRPILMLPNRAMGALLLLLSCDSSLDRAPFALDLDLERLRLRLRPRLSSIECVGSRGVVRGPPPPPPPPLTLTLPLAPFPWSAAGRLVGLEKLWCRVWRLGVVVVGIVVAAVVVVGVLGALSFLV
jgi:hypothetical protein